MKPKFAYAIAASFIAAALSSPVQAAPPLKLFGTPLKGSTRAQLRKTFSDAGLKPERLDARYFCDKYMVTGQLSEAKTLYACYTSGNKQQLAYVEYIFPSFMDTNLVTRVISMVSNKYGSPTSSQGDADLGNVKETWSREDGMRIEVSRGWPSTTTYLDLIDVQADQLLQQQIQQANESRDKARAKHNSGAF